MRLITDKAAWTSVVKDFPKRDAAHEWGYFEAYHQREPALEQVLFYQESPQGKIAYPFFFNQEAKTLSSVYGYTGPLLAIKEEAAWQNFADELAGFCQEEGIQKVEERFHPLLHNEKPLFGQTQLEEKRKVVALKTAEQATLAKLGTSGVRRFIRKAHDSGITVKSCSIEAIDDFLAIYNATMRRKQANELYYFERSFFETLAAEFGERFWLELAYLDGQVIGGSINLSSQTCVYGFLTATNPVYQSLGVSQLLYYSLLEKAYAQQIPYALIGGGFHTDEQDSLFLFKKSFVNRHLEDQEIFSYYTATTTW
ncbi:GNAT family N-acetyltransferase [Enterococcus asini]|uniref:GNAT family N-acetyltransferase n=1 Tax=Enterococcus asini TaxID=57732 RepID=UPI0022E46FA7|nr:GNAT family N-acetyltransferase [Enterococcus asini]